MLSTLLSIIAFQAHFQSATASPSETIKDDIGEENELSPYTPTSALLVPRASTSATYTCGQHKPCSNGACCGKSGFCGYGPTYCGTNGQSPNSDCWSNCDAKAACGQYAADPGSKCPLNVCCSEFGFCGTTPDFCGTGCQSGCNQPSSGSSGGNTQKRIIGYYESWSIGKQCMGMEPNQIPVESLTHLNYAFGYISPGSYEIGPMPGTDASTFSQITDLKQQNGALIVGVSIGGWSFNDNGTDTQPVFGDLVSSPAARKTFINNLLAFMNHYAFDAVDIDWEYPGAPDRQPHQADAKADGDNYVLLMQEIRTAFNGQPKKKYLSFTAPTSYWYLRWFDIGKMVDAADYVNFMTYDLHGVWDANDPIGNQVLAHTNLTEIDLALDLLWRNGVDPGKVNMGLAFYSRTFELSNPSCKQPGCPFKGGGTAGACTATSGILSYREITEVITSKDITPTYDKAAGVKYFTWDVNQWASYDDEQTFQQKIHYANDQGLGGLLIWAIDQDDSNLDALRGVLYPEQLKANNDVANDVSYWQNQQPGACETTSCGGSCSPGTIEITTVACPSGGSKDQKLCCPISSAPDPSTCTWRGDPWFCNGQCHGGEVALASSVDGGNGHCHDGRQFYCCPIPEVADGGGINCGWGDSCSSDQTLMTFAGTFLEDLDPVIAFAGLFGAALADALNKYDISDRRDYCCSNAEFKDWKNCYWAGTVGKGFSSCDDDHCATGIEVELTTSYFGEGESCAPMYERQRAFCCTPSSGQSLFLPVPLADLFPHPPPADVADPIFNLEVDDTWGTGKVEGKDDPNDASFGFVVITAPSEVQVSLSKRDGSPWEVFDCFDDTSEEEQVIRMICTDDDLDNSRCNDIHKGYGAEGTIVEMPQGCGPGRYAVVKSLETSRNQSLPHHLRKRNLQGPVYDLTFDYDFLRVPRDFGDSQLRVDFSNEEGYWNSVVDRPGQTKKKRSDMEEFSRNRKRWLEDEWRDAYHHDGLSREELHKRWFGSDVIAWLANLIGVGQASVTEELHHTVDETLSVILIDQQFGPCQVGPGTAQGNLRATLDAHVEVDTTFGLTIIATLTSSGLSLSDSYLYFRNKGQITATFTLDAVATWTYQSGDVKMIGLDDFPGATFRVPGIVTVGPNIAVYAAVDATLSVAGHLEAKTTIASWEIRQTYPETAQYPVDPLDQPDQDGTQTVGVPTIDASVSASGEVQLHLKPTVTFGIVFDSRWKVGAASVDLVLDGYIIFHAQASASLNGDNSCPFSYGIDAGADVYAQAQTPQIFGWGGQNQINIPGVSRRPILPEKCVGGSSSRRDIRSIDPGYLVPENDTVIASVHDFDRPVSLDVAIPLHTDSLPALYESGLYKRDTFSLGPLITIPANFLNCPVDNDAGGSCPVCQDPNGGPIVTKRDDTDGPDSVQFMTCPFLTPPSDDYCSGDSSDLSKRVGSQKTMSLPWNNKFLYSYYPSCPNGGIGSVKKWFLPRSSDLVIKPKPCDPSVEKVRPNQGTVAGWNTNDFATDHVFEVHLVSDFLSWLCGQPRNTYLGGPIAWPTNWQQPNSVWCQHVFGSIPDSGYAFPASASDRNPDNFVVNTASVLGGDALPGLLAIYLGAANGKKLSWTSGDNVQWVQGNPTATIAIVQLSANVFSYLQDTTLANIQSAWITPSNSIEAISAQFDAHFWGSGAETQAAGIAGATRLLRGTNTNNVATWGLRTLWCYWIDQHLFKIDAYAQNWLNSVRNDLASQTGGSHQTGPNFVANFMQPGQPAGATNFHFPHDPQYATLPLAGSNTPGAAQVQSSKFMMWGNNGNAFGPLGLVA